LTGREAVIYDKMKDDWARLDAVERTAIYMNYMLCNVNSALRVMILDGLEDHYAKLDSITDARIRPAFELASQALGQMTVEFAWQTHAMTTQKMGSIFREPYPEGVPRKNFWRRLLGTE